MERPITILNLPDSAKLKLESLGFSFIEDIEKYLCRHGKVPPSLEDIFRNHEILNKIEELQNISPIESAAEILKNQEQPIFLFHKGLTNLLNGGLSIGQITELCGPPGSGKTQMCLQFCVDVRTPKELGGSEGEAIFISTDFGFHAERLRQISQAAVDHFNKMISTDNFSSENDLEKKLTLEKVLQGVKILEIHKLTNLQKVIENLGEYFQRKENSIKLLVIDSFSTPLIVDIEEPGIRGKIALSILQTLNYLSNKYKFAVILTNQLTTVLEKKGRSVVKPALGQVHAHCIHKRVILKENVAYLTKSIDLPQMFVKFKITNDGIR